jgi:hypothetical protein
MLTRFAGKTSTDVVLEVLTDAGPNSDTAH